MTASSILKLSSIALLTAGIGWIQPSLAQSVSISKAYDLNQGKGLKAFVRVKVIDNNNEPNTHLNREDFTVKSNGKAVKDFILKKPEAFRPDPSRIIILLDMSGSMNKPDENNQIRGIAAMKAIRAFIDSINSQDLPAEIAIVPFAEGGKGCNKEAYLPPAVNDAAIDKFSSPNSPNLNSQLLDLESKFQQDKKNKRPCGSTNIREPLQVAIQYLASKYSEQFDPSKPQMHLGIILISDGYDPVLSTAIKNNKPELKNLEDLLKKNSSITLHTLGYGVANGGGKNGAVDPIVLERLAKASRGIYRFSGNEAEITASLATFLRALLGEYEIVYTPANAESGAKEIVEISVAGVSGRKTFPINNILLLPRGVRIQILVWSLILFFILGYLPFLAWRQWLEKNV